MGLIELPLVNGANLATFMYPLLHQLRSCMFPLSHMMKAFVRKGRLTVIDAGGREHVFAGGTGPQVTMRLTDRRLYRTLVFNSELAAGEAYMDGTLRFENGSTLRDFLTLFSINRLSLGSYPIQKLLRAIKMRSHKRQQSNAKGEAQRNVAHHYDLGNEFYKLFLDDNMLYSCAYFREPDETLEQAQRNKLRLLAAKLNLKPGMKVLDIGCGWGDMALYLAQLENVEVVGVTLSKEQQLLATERAKNAGLDHRVRFDLRDYRDITERFDRIVSIGMFEHVGVNHYDEFFKKLNALMPDDGIAVIHSIGHMSPPGMASAWLRKYIFPGAYSPALGRIRRSRHAMSARPPRRVHDEGGGRSPPCGEEAKNKCSVGVPGEGCFGPLTGLAMAWAYLLGEEPALMPCCHGQSQ